MRPARFQKSALIVTVIGGLSVCALLGSGTSLRGCGAADQNDQIRKAQRQFDAGDYTAATMTLQSVISQEPGSAEAHYWLGEPITRIEITTMPPRRRKSRSRLMPRTRFTTNGSDEPMAGRRTASEASPSQEK